MSEDGTAGRTGPGGPRSGPLPAVASAVGPVAGASRGPVLARAEAAPPERRRLLRRRPRRKLSEILADMAADESRERVTIADLVRAMHGRAFGALLLVFALPNALPAIPGTSGILGLPLLFLAAQMTLGRPPWLPRFISLRGMARGDFATLVARVTPWLERADTLTASRLHLLVDGPAERVVGLICLILATVLVLPVPFGNMLPGLAICMVALGVLERDGLWVVVGTITGALALVVAWGVIYAMAVGAWFILANAF